MSTYILLDAGEYQYLKNNKDFKEIMKNSKISFSLIQSEEEKSYQEIDSKKPISEFLDVTFNNNYADLLKSESPKKPLSPSKFSLRKSIREFFFPMKETILQKVDENEEFIGNRSKKRFKNRMKNLTFLKSKDNLESSDEKKLLQINRISLLPKKGQQILYEQFQKLFREKNSNNDKWSMNFLLIVSLIKLFASLGIRSSYFINGYTTFALNLIFLIALTLLKFYQIRKKEIYNKYYTFFVFIILVYEIQVLIIENHYVRSDLFDKLTLLHIMMIVLFGTRLK